MRIKIYLKHISIFVITILVSSVFVSNRVSALTDAGGAGGGNGSLNGYEKAVATSLESCYVNTSSSGSDFRDPLTIEMYKNYSGVYSFMVGNTTVPVPDGYFDKNKMKCTDFVAALLNRKSISIPDKNDNDDQIEGFLANLGYSGNNAGVSTGKCVSFLYDVGGTQKSTQKVCATVVNSDGTIGTDNVIILDGDKTALEFQSAKNSSITLDCATFNGFSKGGCGTISFVKNSTMWEDFVDAMENMVLENNASGSHPLLDAAGGSTSYRLSDINNPTKSEPYVDNTYSFTLSSNAINNGRSFLVGYTGNLAYNDQEQFVLYQNYLKNFYGADILCDLTENEITVKTSEGYKEVRIYSGGEFKTCYAKATKNNNSSVNGIDGSTRLFGSENCDFNCLTNWLKDSTVSSLPDDADIENANEHGINTSPESSSGSSSEGDDTVCYKGAGAIGWIVCPIIKGISGVGESMWDFIQDKFLQIPAGKIFEDGSTVASGWGVVRDIANVLFIVLFLFVIFSQLTGVGIDNYGIKKIMPKLVTVAVLMNLSFLICGLAVDLSNILGKGLDDLLSNNVASVVIDLGEANASYETVNKTQATVGGIIGGVLAGGGLVLYTIFGGLGVIGTALAALGVVLSIVVAILTLFLILIIREAGIVVAIVLAPIAIVCYMLPNTEKFYKKWFDIFKALLIVYPICGALMGGGKLASAVLGGIEGMGLVATIVQVLPFFLIPTLLKNSLALLGNVGAKVSNLGRGISGRANKAIRGTDAMKASMQEASDRRIMRKAGINAKTGELTARGERRAKRAGGFLGKLSGYDRMQSARIRAAQDVRGKDIAAGAALVGAVATSEMVDKSQTPVQYYEEQMDEAARSGDITAYETAVEAAITSGQLKDKDIAAMVRRTIGQTQSSVKDEGVRQNFYRKMAAKHGNGFMATDVEMRSWMQQSGKLKQQNGQMVNYNISSSVAGDYASRGGMSVDDIKLSDVQKMSGDSMAAMITSGILSQGMAREALKSGGLSDDKKIMLGAAANEAVPTGMSSDDLKSHAKVLANGPGSDPTDLNRINAYNSARNALGGISDDQVAMWVSPPPEDVVVRDVAYQNVKDGSNTPTNDLSASIAGGTVNTNITGGSINANITNDTLNVNGTVDVGNEVDVNVRHPVQVVRVPRRKRGK